VIVGVLSYKGGVGKTTLAIHLSHLLNGRKPALLVDGDLNRSALAWSQRGELGFKVIDERQASRYSRNFDNIVLDTGARPSEADLRAMVDGCDQLIVLSGCDALSLDALMPAVETLQRIGAGNFRVLLNLVPPVGNAGAEAREMLVGAGLPLFKNHIRRWAAFAQAALEGRTVDDVRNEHAQDAWSDIQAVGRELTR
jgi:chromosome partitioning protein